MTRPFRGLSSPLRPVDALTASAARLLRRDVLKIGGLGMFGLTMPKLLKATESSKSSGRSGTAKSVIFLFQWGGPSHVDTFDLKLDAPDGIKTKYGHISSALPGLPVVEYLPETAKILDKVTLVRTLTHTMKNHNSAGYYALTGWAPPLDDQRLRDSQDLMPGYGSIVDAVSPNTDGLPTFVAFPHSIADGSTVPGQHASFLGKAHDPLLILEDPNRDDFKLPELSLPAGMTMERLANRRELQKLINKQSRMLEYSAEARGLDAYYEKAIGMLDSPKVREAFDLSKEPNELREAYGRTTYGQSCLLARRLAEAGVSFINVYFDQSIGGQKTDSGGWDTHGFNDTRQYEILHKRHLPITDQTLPTLLNDLEQRGLLDSTLVVWVGEFGRTPKINGNVSRDHWPRCYTALLAGGGVKKGFLYGKSDKSGAYPDTDPVTPDDLSATIYALMGIDPETEIRDALDRPLPLSGGRVIYDVMA
ncbi:MAG: DUF1501 domain-containing protein [Planctomycetaceae bacterium]|nr:DUF1501 domain-containing protein [Planctomycetaceae bacterium]